MSKNVFLELENIYNHKLNTAQYYNKEDKSWTSTSNG